MAQAPRREPAAFGPSQPCQGCGRTSFTRATRLPEGAPVWQCRTCGLVQEPYRSWQLTEADVTLLRAMRIART